MINLMPDHKASHFQTSFCAACSLQFARSQVGAHAQPLASSMVSARSAVVFKFLSRSLLRSLRISFASILTLATSLTIQPIFNVLFSSKCLSKVVLPAKGSSSIKEAVAFAGK